MAPDANPPSPEIEITPVMLAAGIAALARWYEINGSGWQKEISDEEDDWQGGARAVYEAMERVRLGQKKS